MENFNNYTGRARDARSKNKLLGLWRYAMVLVAFFIIDFGVSAQTPCQATRWNSGDGWRYNTSTQKWDAVKVTGSNTLPLGVVACASAASTQSGLEAFKTVYNGNFALQQRTACFNQETSQRDPNLTINPPTAGTTEIVWFNFDIRPLAGTYQFQIVTNQAMGWMLYYSNESQPTGGNTSDGKYPRVGSSPNSLNLSGDCSNLTYADCGKSGNGWSTITVPSFNEPTNYYLAIFPLNGGTISSSANLVYKARYGCGGATCTIEKVGDDELTCNSNSTYTVCADFQGSAGRWRLQDNANNKASSYTITTFDANNQQVGSTLTSSNLSTSPIFLTLGTVDNGAVYATICATYANGDPYNIGLIPDAAYSPSNNYVTCTDGIGFSGGGISPPVVSAGVDKVIDCRAENGQITLTATSDPSGVTYKWVASNGGVIVGDDDELTVTVSAAGTYTFTSTTANGCSASDAAAVTLDQTKPLARATGGALDCTTNELQLSGVGSSSGDNYSYLWTTSDGNILSGETTLIPLVNVVGTYTLTVTNTNNGCIETAQAVVTPAVNCVTSEGCTPGYWKNRKGNWSVSCGTTVLSKNSNFNTVFGLNTSPANSRLKKQNTLTLGKALDLQGGGSTNGYEQLGRAGAAAIFNACSMGYALSSTEVISKVQAGFAGDQALALQIAAELDRYNNANCVLDNSGKMLTSSSTTSLQGLDLAESHQLRAYPTPFTDKAVIEFTVARDEIFSMRLYDMRGALVRELKSGEAKAGLVNTVEVDGKGLPEGLYIARMISDSGSKTVKLLKKE